jgi:hypothetical protein
LKVHPALTAWRDAWTLYSRLIRELRLDVTPPAEAPRPPALAGRNGGR